MNGTTRGERFAASISAQTGGSRMPSMPTSPLQEAFENYERMTKAVETLQKENAELRQANAIHVAEINMANETINRIDVDRVRLQSVSSTLLGQLMAINAVIADAVKMSVKHGIEAVEEFEAQKRGEVVDTTIDPQHLPQEEVLVVPARTPAIPINRM